MHTMRSLSQPEGLGALQWVEHCCYDSARWHVIILPSMESTTGWSCSTETTSAASAWSCVTTVHFCRREAWARTASTPWRSTETERTYPCGEWFDLKLFFFFLYIWQNIFGSVYFTDGCTFAKLQTPYFPPIPLLLFNHADSCFICQEFVKKKKIPAVRKMILSVVLWALRIIIVDYFL